jgi:peptidoglycan hydrolase-like protein with peptidoglycan-binding domain
MTAGRVLFGEGAQGDLVRAIQTQLAHAGVYRAAVDGDYGGATAQAVRLFRRKKGLPLAPFVDPQTWTTLTNQPVPTVRDRALQVTASFEGHGFTLAMGNFDGAGITWGVIGFTLKSGSLTRIVLDVQASQPRLVQQAFGPKAAELIGVMRASWARQLAFANSITIAGGRLAEPWRSSFRRFGELPQVQKIQLQHVDGYFNPAKQDARALGLKTELGLALCFDIRVQNGSIAPSAMRRIKAAQAAHSVKDERELRVLIAHAVADTANPTFRADVLSRKLTFAMGVGVVHGGTYVLRNWGLAEVPSAARPQPAPQRGAAPSRAGAAPSRMT